MGENVKAQRRADLDAMDTSALAQSVNWFVLLAGTANVIMQLANRPVAYGVMESTGAGALFADPKRRMRTTTGYIAVTMLGDADMRAAYRAATNRSHAPVRSAEGAEVVRLEYLGRDIPARVVRLRIRLTAGYLGPRFRELMALPWTDDDERAFDRFNRRMAAFQRRSPRALRELPLRRSLRGIRRRLDAGQPLF